MNYTSIMRKFITTLITLTFALLITGCVTQNTGIQKEKQSYHCQKCRCKHFSVTDPKLLHTSNCVDCSHDAESHGISNEVR